MSDAVRAKVSLAGYRAEGYDPGPLWKRAAWYLVSRAAFETRAPIPSRAKRALLRAFGAQVGAGTVIKPQVKIKFPWRLRVGAYTWIGEQAWIDNLAPVALGDNVCISQGAYLCTGNHDYTSPRFSLRTAPITVEDGAWVGARATVCPGVAIATHSVLAVGTVAAEATQPYGIYRGNPMQWVRERRIR